MQGDLFCHTGKRSGPEGVFTFLSLCVPDSLIVSLLSEPMRRIKKKSAGKIVVYVTSS